MTQQQRTPTTVPDPQLWKEKMKQAYLTQEQMRKQEQAYLDQEQLLREKKMAVRQTLLAPLVQPRNRNQASRYLLRYS